MQDGAPAVDRLGLPFVSSGQFAYVFKLKHPNGKASAIRCFRGFLGDREIRYRAINHHLDSVVIPALASFEYDPQGILVGPNRYPTLVMEWVDGPTLDVYLEAALQNRAVILHLAEQWIKVVNSLRTAQVAHGDLQHGNIIVQTGTLRLVDLDGMFVPSMSQLNSSEIGHRHYQHPLRDPFFFNRDLDNFSALVVYLSLISLAERPDLWRKFHDENLLLTRTDFLNPSSSPAFAQIKSIGGEPKRLAEILERACTSAPSMTPALADLVTAKSKLPSWMVEPAGIVIPTRTREAIPGQALSGASSSPTSLPVSTPTWKPSPQSSQQPGIVASIPQQVPQFDWKQVRINTVSIAVAFGLTGLVFVWAWFPLVNGIYRDLGLQADSVTLTIWTYILGSVGFGFFKAFQKAKSASRGILASAVSATPPSYPLAPIRSTAPVLIPSPRTPAHARYTRSTPPHAVAVVGSRARLIYHNPSCEWARKISARNKVSFASTTDARAAGYRRCGVCLP